MQPELNPQAPGEQTIPVRPPASRTYRLATFGTYNPARDKQESSMRTTVAAVVALSVFMAVVLMLILFSSLGTTGLIVGLVMALTPAPLYMLLYVWLDRFDPEPGWILMCAFGWGAIFSLLVSFVVNTIFGTVIASVVAGPAGEMLPAMISAPVIEEASKGSGLLMALLFLRREFDGVLDGVVYAGVIALGFATGENVLYYGKTFLESGLGGLLMIGFLRGVLSPFAHSMFTSLTGIGCGIARETHDRTLRLTMPLAGYFAAVLLHAMWNALASNLEDMFIVAYFLVWVPLFVLFLVVVVLLSRRERRILRRMLTTEVESGAIDPAELKMMGSAAHRFAWVFSSIGNSRKFQARRKYIKAMTKLGLCHWHASRADQAGKPSMSLPHIPRLRAQLLALKPQI